MRLALGTVQFGLDYGIANAAGQVAPEEVARILTLAQQLGIDTLDTAINYGHSESVLGQCGISPWQVVTKLPALPDGALDVAEWAHSHMRQSLARLGVVKVHAVLLHKPLAVRAVGTAVGRNPVGIIVPCHRVLGADGSLTGYAGGLGRKAALLTLESGARRTGQPAPTAWHPNS